MKNLFKIFAVLAVTALLVSSSFAGNNNPVDCARQYRNCLNYCNQVEAQAKATKANCEKNAKLSYPQGGTAYNNAIKACRDAYNATMQNVAQCRTNCYNAYQNCLGGGYEGEG